jgi:hypothetical protein
VTPSSQKINQNLTLYTWYIRPSNLNKGNHLTIAYYEDARFNRPDTAKSLFTLDLKKIGEYYMSCPTKNLIPELRPERYYFSSGYYYSKFNLTNFSASPADSDKNQHKTQYGCTLAGVNKVDLSKAPKISENKNITQNIKENLRNPNLRAALLLIFKNKNRNRSIAENKTEPQHFNHFLNALKLSPTNYSASNLNPDQEFHPASEIELGNYITLTEIPEEVLKAQVVSPAL